MEELDNANSIRAFNRLEKEGHVERSQCHFRLVDLACDASYALGMPTIWVVDSPKNFVASHRLQNIVARLYINK